MKKYRVKIINVLIFQVLLCGLILGMEEKSYYGVHQTLNSNGFVWKEHDEYNESFIDYAAKANGPCLEIGAGYGLATIKSLERGAKIIANDLEETHLKIIEQNVDDSKRERLTLKPGRFPEDLEFPPESLDAVLASMILHFVEPDTLPSSIDKVFSWLKNGGKFFVRVGSPFWGIFQKNIPIYEKRRSQNEPWPGLIKDVPSCAPDFASDFPRWINLLDKDQVINLLQGAGFQIEKISYIPASKENVGGRMYFNGCEYVGVIAFKG